MLLEEWETNTLKHAGTNALNISGTYIMGAVFGRPSPNGTGGLRYYQRHWPPHILKALATHSFKRIGHPHILKAASHPLLKKLSCRELGLR